MPIYPRLINRSAAKPIQAVAESNFTLEVMGEQLPRR